ncbi:hypothetical protein GCM10023314_30040 [Algibacter agarivorans]|uniref:N-acetyltransferase domain-containing protein n=1 Tax=Algibacter agarivorans TaxID=1109741 RepID=A0ABP9GW33_9FLAO
MNIYKLEIVTETIISALQRLITQLSNECNPPSKEDIISIINSDNITLFLAEVNDEIIGTLSLVFNKIPSGDKVWIEDVVIDKSVRGKGLGKRLILFAIDYIKSKNIDKINLTSSPERVAANNLYQNLGFGKRDTNVYRLTIK